MKVFSTVAAIREFLRPKQLKGKSVGFVPTMGALHQGHLSLVERSVKENNLTVCSIFVNPIQFNNRTDLENYPKTPEQDLKLLEKEGCDAVFMPEADEMYPEGERVSDNIDFGYLDKILEGKFRPGHFRGVVIIVKKLFEIIEPRRAYFGKKDYQQLLIISKMVEKLNLPLEIVPCPIIREPDGLAMSSRNMRMSIRERQLAPLIYQVLSEMKDKVGTATVRNLKESAVNRINKEPLFHVEYIEIADKFTLQPLSNWKTKENAIALAAVYLNDIRLIDNLEFFI